MPDDQEPINCKDLERKLQGILRKRSCCAHEVSNPDFTDDCLSLDRVFVAIGLTPLEQQHILTCEFCKRRIEAFRTINIEMQQSKKKQQSRIIKIWPAINVRRITVAALIFISLAIIGWTGVSKIKHLLGEASKLRKQLDDIRLTIGLENAAFVDFIAIEPNTVKLSFRLNPALIESSDVSYNQGETWQRLYDANSIEGAIRPEAVLDITDSHSFMLPVSGSKTIDTIIRAQYAPGVLAAFPEYAQADKCQWRGRFKLTPDGITKIAMDSGKPVGLMAEIPMDDKWELINSPKASINLQSVSSAKTLTEIFNLADIGEYVNISHAIPGSKLDGTVCFDELTDIEVGLLWNGVSSITLEIKLVDDSGKVAGTSRFIEPDAKQQILTIPAKGLKGYWNVRNFDYSKVRRFEIAIARKASDQASAGSMILDSVKFFGTGQAIGTSTTVTTAVLAELSLEKSKWGTASSERGGISLAEQAGMLACTVDLPYDSSIDKELPWTNLQTDIETKDFHNLMAIELTVRWDGPAPITIEPKIVTGEYLNTYGMQKRINDGLGLQTITISISEMKFYWSSAGDAKAGTGLELNKLKTFSLGIARKATDQASQGTLYIKGIKLLGSPKM